MLTSYVFIYTFMSSIIREMTCVFCRWWSLWSDCYLCSLIRLFSETEIVGTELTLWLQMWCQDIQPGQIQEVFRRYVYFCIKIYRGCSLESPYQGNTNEYPQDMFHAKVTSASNSNEFLQDTCPCKNKLCQSCFCYQNVCLWHKSFFSWCSSLIYTQVTHCLIRIIWNCLWFSDSLTKVI